MPVMQHVASVEDYIQSQPDTVKSTLEQLRKTIKEAAPEAAEVISYGMPAFKQDGILVWYAATKKHFGFYPKPEAITVFAEQLRPYDVSKGTIRFPIDKPLPLTLIKQIVAFRLKENKAMAAVKKATAKRPASRKTA